MRYLSFSRTVTVALTFLVLVATSAAQQRRFSVQDSIEISTFLDSAQQFGPLASQASFSPDKSHFVAVTVRGNPTTGEREATVWLFDSKGVREYLKTRTPADFASATPLTRWRSKSNVEPISFPRWSSDSRSLLFLAADDDGAKRLFRVGIEGGNAVALSRSEQDVSRFDECNGAVVYLAHKPIRAVDLYQAGGSTLPDVLDGTGKNILELLFPHSMEAAFNTSEDELWKIEDGKPAAVMDAERKMPVRVKDSTLSLAPNGGRVIVTLFVKHIPKSWERYQPLDDYPGFRIVADTPATEGSTGVFRPKEYASVNLANGQTAVLLDAPIELYTAFYELVPQWSSDGSSVALPGAYPALNAVLGIGPVFPCTVMVVDFHGNSDSCLESAVPPGAQTKRGDWKQAVSLQWRNGNRELQVLYATQNAPAKKTETVYTRSGDAWASKSFNVSTAPDELAVEVHQAIDESPVLVANVGNGPSRRLLDPNPQLRNIALGTVTLYEWRDPDGDVWTGALVKPPEYSADKRYPLIIQTHGLDRARFLVDGPSATAFAGRAFAARDIVVLQVDESHKNMATPKETETGVRAYRAAIQQLEREGLVDPAKVGIIGWSHFGSQLMQGLVDQPHAYAAASIAEADYNSYGQYLINIDYLGAAREQQLRAQFGVKPFGSGLKTWLENSPGFHSDQICAPVLFQFNSPPALVYGWDFYATLRAQDKPVDLLYIRNGEHMLVKSLERLAEQGMNVDWFDFWLNGHIDPDLAKAQQYKRWDAMKTLRRCSED
ncbi:MAG: hypothetical protein JO041_08035 [Acidobacteria bacterium]|nr:hypothetical protein [Acidobacteriota bacterium]